MNLISIDTKTFQTRVYAVRPGRRVKIADAQCDRILRPSEVEDMRKDPDAFVRGPAVENYTPPQPEAA